AFKPSAKNVLRNTDKRRKSSIIERMRKGITGIEVPIFACSLGHLQRTPVLDRIPGEIVATDQARGIPRNPAVKVLAGRIARRHLFNSSCRRAGIRSARDSLDRAKVTQCGAQQVMCGDKEVAGANREPASDFPINLEAGLLRIRNGTVPICVTVSDGSRSRNTSRGHLAGPEKISNNLCRRLRTRYAEREGVQLIYCALRASAIRRQICVWKNGRTLWIRDEQEGESVAVVEEAETRPDDSLPVRGIGESNARLKALVTHVHLVRQSRLEVIAQTVVEGQLFRELPLILNEEPVIAVVQVHREVFLLLGQVRRRPPIGRQPLDDAGSEVDGPAKRR